MPPRSRPQVSDSDSSDTDFFAALDRSKKRKVEVSDSPGKKDLSAMTNLEMKAEEAELDAKISKTTAIINTKEHEKADLQAALAAVDVNEDEAEMYKKVGKRWGKENKKQAIKATQARLKLLTRYTVGWEQGLEKGGA